MGSPRSTTARLSPGEDTIMRSEPREQPNGTYWLDWSYAPLDGSKRVHHRARGATKGEARRRAREKLAELQVSGSRGSWKPSSDLADYIDKVAKPALKKADLAPLTVTRYEIAFALLLGDCASDEHRHRHGLRKHTIKSGTRFKTLEDLLTEIATLHGRETARQARTVLTKYILMGLTRDELITGNPIAGVSLDELTGTRKSERTRGGKALTRDQYDKVLDYLLALDPAEGVVRRQGRWSLEALVSKRRNSIDQALFQAATGLRATEANLLTWGHLDDDGTTMSVFVPEHIAKGGIPRTSLVLDNRVAERLCERRAGAGATTELIIGSPTDPATAWDRNNSSKAARELYPEKVEVEVLETERSHQ